MKILATFPGKFGDLLWALPTLRALSRRIGEPVDLLTTQDMASIIPLLTQQPYIRHAFANSHWVDADVYPLERRQPPPEGVEALQVQLRYDHILHLGYPDWPQRGLPYYTLDTLNTHAAARELALFDADLHLEEPWITAGARADWQYAWGGPQHIAVGFSDEHFELKVGLWHLIEEGDFHRGVAVIGQSPRWQDEAGKGTMNWAESVATLQQAHVCLACCSGLHVLAVACGIPVVMMEPSEARWNKIFYPLGDTGPQVTLVRGTDGLPTFDARHVADTLHSVLTAQKAPR